MELSIIVLVVVFVVLLLFKVPIAYCLALSAAATFMVTVEFTAAISTMSQRMATGLDSFVLLAIPFFVFAGYLMGTGGIASRLTEFAKSLLGAIPGGLAVVNIVSCMLFGAISGSAIAAATAMGSFMHPRMIKEGYEPGFSASVNVTSATTGLIIPPSNVLIVYAFASGGISIAALFLAGYLPGILTGFLLMVVAGYIAHKKGYGKAERVPLKEVIIRFGDSLLSLTLIIIVIGGIVSGIFTATEAAAIAVIYALFLTMIVYREVKPTQLPEIIMKSVITTSVVMLLVSTSIGLSWVMSFIDLPQTIAASLLAISENPIIILLIINIVFLVVGTFMDMTPAILIFTPIFLPAVVLLGMDPIHFGIVMVLNLSIGLCTPPVGTVLFAGAGVANISIVDMVRPLIPFYIAMLISLILLIIFPEIALFLPRIFGF